MGTLNPSSWGPAAGGGAGEGHPGHCDREVQQPAGWGVLPPHLKAHSPPQAHLNSCRGQAPDLGEVRSDADSRCQSPGIPGEHTGGAELEGPGAGRGQMGCTGRGVQDEWGDIGGMLAGGGERC